MAGANNSVLVILPGVVVAVTALLVFLADTFVGRRKGMNHRVDLTQLESLRPVGRLGRAQYVRLRQIETLLRPDGPND